MKPSIIKSTIVLAMALLPLFSFGKEQITKTENETFVENEFIIWLEQGVDATTFAANSNAGITPKRLLSHWAEASFPGYRGHFQVHANKGSSWKSVNDFALRLHIVHGTWLAEDGSHDIFL